MKHHIFTAICTIFFVTAGAAIAAPLGIDTILSDTLSANISSTLVESGDDSIRLKSKSASGDNWVIVVNPDASDDGQLTWAFTDDVNSMATLGAIGNLAVDSALDVGKTYADGNQAGTDICIDGQGRLCVCGRCS